MKNITRTKPIIAAIALALFLATALITATPQGRALAQRLFQFFTLSEGEVVPQPTANIVLYAVTPGAPVPTPTVHPDSIPAFFESCGDYLAPRCTIAQIMTMVDYPVQQLSEIPQGFSFLGATGGPQSIALIYEHTNNGTRLFLSVVPWKESGNVLPSVPPSTQIETVQIGSSTGEYVQGSWFTDAGPNATWDPNSGLQTLRWRDGGVLYTLELINHPGRNSGLDRDWLVNLAQSLTAEPVETTSVQPGLEPDDPALVSEIIVVQSVVEASQQAGFDVIETTWLPEGYSFSSVSISPDHRAACLHYRHTNSMDGDGTLHVFQSPSVSLPEVENLANLADQFTKIETLTVGGAQSGSGQFIQANMAGYELCGLESSYREGLLWSTDQINYIIFAGMVDPVTWMPSRLQLVWMAEGLTGMHTVTDETIDPDRLRSVEEAEALAGFDLVEPTRLPAGEVFTYGTSQVIGGHQWVSLNYTNFGITQISRITQTLDASYQHDPAIDEAVFVHGQTAFYRQGCREADGWNKDCFGTFSLVWHENGIEYRLWGTMSYLLPREVILAIAESLQ